jgi:hypothetical protein
MPEMYVDDTNLIYFDYVINRDKLVKSIEMNCIVSMGG